MAKKGARRRASQSAPGGVKTGTGTYHGVWWPPIPGWCRKLGAKRAFRTRRTASGRATQRVRRGSDPGGPGPVGESSWRRRPEGDTLFLCVCVCVCVCAVARGKALTGDSCSSHFHVRADPADRVPCGTKILFSRPKSRLPFEISSRVRYSFVDPALLCFCFGDSVAKER
jgi:hypothetical protein